MGWVLTAFQNPFHWLLSGTALEAAVIATVGKGGDADTNATICGALLGAVQGREAVPTRWRNAVLTCRPMEGSASRHPRPAPCCPDDALEFAEALLAAGASPGGRQIAGRSTRTLWNGPPLRRRIA
jgi:ADP-ribosyl-[dinitrogen reductase] hydrolase